MQEKLRQRDLYLQEQDKKKEEEMNKEMEKQG